MKLPPNIAVQLIHIQGPMKGEIQEFTDHSISIGRNPSGQVHFPKDLTIISRKHAEIIREGNRFKVVDQSSNGTFVNGKRVKEAFLKDGDVLTFAEGGPKVSFLTKVVEGQQPEAQKSPEPGPPPEVKDIPMSPPPEPQPIPRIDRPPVSAPPPHQAEPAPSVEQPVQKVQMPLVVQYGPTLRSFKELPVTIGRSPSCEFVLDHPGIRDKHAQIFFGQDAYWVKDLTGEHALSLNGQPVQLQTSIKPDDILALSPQGPNFRFLGGGRLAEIETSEPEQPVRQGQQAEEKTPQEKDSDKSLKGAKAIFQKFLRR